MPCSRHPIRTVLDTRAIPGCIRKATSGTSRAFECRVALPAGPSEDWNPHTRSGECDFSFSSYSSSVFTSVRASEGWRKGTSTKGLHRFELAQPLLRQYLSTWTKLSGAALSSGASLASPLLSSARIGYLEFVFAGAFDPHKTGARSPRTPTPPNSIQRSSSEICTVAIENVGSWIGRADGVLSPKVRPCCGNRNEIDYSFRFIISIRRDETRKRRSVFRTPGHAGN
jgi:hypothetical protein